MLLNHCYIGNNETDIEKGAIEVSKFYNNFGAWFKNSRKVVQGTLDPLTQEEIDNPTGVKLPTTFSGQKPMVVDGSDPWPHNR